MSLDSSYRLVDPEPEKKDTIVFKESLGVCLLLLLLLFYFFFKSKLVRVYLHTASSGY